MKFKISKDNKWNKWDDLVNWKEELDNLQRFTIVPFGDKYELIFSYNDSKDNPDIKYTSSLFGTVEVCRSSSMRAGTCDTIKFETRLSRDLFIANFYSKFTDPSYNPYSIRDVLFDTRCVTPDTFDEFSTDVQWRDIFKRFRMYEEDEKYVLEFVYKGAVNK